MSCGFASSGLRSGHIGQCWAGPELKARLQGIALALGPYPHARLKVASKKAPSCKRALARCTGCGYQVPMLRKFLSFGPPICPQHKVAMEPLGDWEED